MNVFLTPATVHQSDFLNYPLERIRASYANDKHQQHQLVDDPAKADVILIATNYRYPPLGFGLFQEAFFRRHSNKCVLFDSSDLPSPISGGLCASWPSSLLQRSAAAAVGWCYFHPTSAEPQITFQDWPAEGPKYLWSFGGSRRTHAVRDHIFSLLSESEHVFLQDTSQRSLSHLRGEKDSQDSARFITDYINLIRQSAFVLCPRGVGASSMRIFEAMRAGRAPVIIADNWTPPPFVDWDSCSIRIPEQKVSQINNILSERKAEAPKLGKNARQEWERIFGEPHLFHHTVEAARLVLESRHNSSLMDQLARYFLVLRAPYRQQLLRELRQLMRR